MPQHPPQRERRSPNRHRAPRPGPRVRTGQNHDRSCRWVTWLARSSHLGSCSPCYLSCCSLRCSLRCSSMFRWLMHWSSTSPKSTWARRWTGRCSRRIAHTPSAHTRPQLHRAWCQTTAAKRTETQPLRRCGSGLTGLIIGVRAALSDPPLEPAEIRFVLADAGDIARRAAGAANGVGGGGLRARRQALCTSTRNGERESEGQGGDFGLHLDQLR